MRMTDAQKIFKKKFKMEQIIQLQTRQDRRKSKIYRTACTEVFLEKCQQVGDEAQRLWMHEKNAKARESSYIPDHEEVGEEQELQREILGNQQSLHSRQPTKKENYEDSHS